MEKQVISPENQNFHHVSITLQGFLIFFWKCLACVEDLKIILYLSFKGLQKWYILESRTCLAERMGICGNTGPMAICSLSRSRYVITYIYMYICILYMRTYMRAQAPPRPDMNQLLWMTSALWKMKRRVAKSKVQKPKNPRLHFKANLNQPKTAPWSGLLNCRILEVWPIGLWTFGFLDFRTLGF